MPMVEGGPDEITVARARRGDRIAQADVLRAVQDRLWRVCLGLMHTPQSAEDAQQEAALRILTHLPSFGGRSKFTTWATGIAVNVCREQRRRSRLSKLSAQPVPPSAFAAEPAAADADDIGRLQAALTALPDRQREAVVLRYLEGLDVAQTAELMGVARGTVKATVHAGLKRLREALDDAA